MGKPYADSSRNRPSRWRWRQMRRSAPWRHKFAGVLFLRRRIRIIRIRVRIRSRVILDRLDLRDLSRHDVARRVETLIE